MAQVLLRCRAQCSDQRDMVMQPRQMQPREGQFHGTAPLLRGQPRLYGNLSGPVARLVDREW